MRLLFVTAEAHPSFRADVRTLFGTWLPRDGVYSDLVALAAQGGPSAAPWPGGDALVCPAGGIACLRHAVFFSHVLRVLLRARAERYVAIQVRDLPLLAALALVVCRCKGLKFFYWMSYPIPEGQIALARERGLSAGVMRWVWPWVRGRVGRFLLYRLVLPRADHVFVQSKWMLAALAHKGVAPERMTAIPMGVDLESMAEMNVAPSDDQRLIGRRVLVYLGSFDRPRRLELLFQVLAIVKRAQPTAILVLVGGTADQVHLDWLKARAVECGVGNDIVWTGWLPMGAGWSYVRAAEVAFSPVPRGELLDVSSPTKVPEYLALGVPVVCNDNPDQAEVIAATGCGLCVPFTAQNFADAALALLDLGDEQRAKMQRAAMVYLGQHRDYARIAGTLAARYVQLLPVEVD